MGGGRPRKAPAGGLMVWTNDEKTPAIFRWLLGPWGARRLALQPGSLRPMLRGLGPAMKPINGLKLRTELTSVFSVVNKPAGKHGILRGGSATVAGRRGPRHKPLDDSPAVSGSVPRGRVTRQREKLVEARGLSVIGPPLRPGCSRINQQPVFGSLARYNRGTHL